MKIQLQLLPNADKTSNCMGLNPDTTFSIDGVDDGTFAIAADKNTLRLMMKSDTNMAHDEKKFFFDENDEAMSWEARTLSKQHRCKDIKDHTSARTGLSDTGKSRV